MSEKSSGLWGTAVHFYKKHEEIIRYLVVGGLTTLLNIVVFAIGVLITGESSYMAWQVIAFIVAVIFAYYANKHAVFHSKTESRQDAAREAGSFFLMRIISFGLETLMLWLLVDKMGVLSIIAKVPITFIVIVLNYIFSKMFIFRNAEDKPAGGEEN